MYTEFVRERLKAERAKAGYTQRQLADMTGLSQPLIAKIESGTRSPDIETIGLLAEFYSVSLDYLFGLGRREKKKNDQERNN